MIEKLTGLLRMTARNLEELSGTTPPEGDQEEPEVQPTEDEPLEPATPQEDRPPPPSYWQRFATAEREHFGWLRRNPLVVGITLGFKNAFVPSNLFRPIICIITFLAFLGSFQI